MILLCKWNRFSNIIKKFHDKKSERSIYGRKWSTFRRLRNILNTSLRNAYATLPFFIVLFRFQTIPSVILKQQPGDVEAQSGRSHSIIPLMITRSGIYVTSTSRISNSIPSFVQQQDHNERQSTTASALRIPSFRNGTTIFAG